MRRKKVIVSGKVWSGLMLVISKSRRDLHKVAEEGFQDLLEKHGRPVDLKDQLARSIARDERQDVQAA